MVDVWHPSVLTAAINILKPVPTPVLDRLFSRKAPQMSENLAWDVITATELLAKNIKANAPASVSSIDAKNNVACVAPRYSEKKLIPASYFNGLRQFGDAVAMEQINAEIGRNQATLRRKIDLTREFQASRALSGVVVDSAGNTIVDYAFAGAQSPVLAGKDKWTDSESKILKNLRAWKKLIVNAVGAVDSFIAFVGTDVMDAMIANTTVQELLKYQSGNQLAQTGRILTLAEIEIVEIMGSYLTTVGVRTDQFDASHLALVGLQPDTAAELYAPVCNLEAMGGVGSGQAASMMYSDSWVEKDPSGRWIRVESRPLPVLFKPGAVIYAKPV